MTTTSLAAEIDSIVDKAVTQGIDLGNLIDSLRAIYQPKGEAIFRPSARTLATLSLLKDSLVNSIEQIEAIR